MGKRGVLNSSIEVGKPAEKRQEGLRKRRMQIRRNRQHSTVEGGTLLEKLPSMDEDGGKVYLHRQTKSSHGMRSRPLNENLEDFNAKDLTDIVQEQTARFRMRAPSAHHAKKRPIFTNPEPLAASPASVKSYTLFNDEVQSTVSKRPKSHISNTVQLKAPFATLGDAASQAEKRSLSSHCRKRQVYVSQQAGPKLNESALRDFNTFDQLKDKIQAAYRYNERGLVEARARNVERFINTQSDKPKAVTYAANYLDKIAGLAAKEPSPAKAAEDIEGMPLKEYMWNGELKDEERMIDAVLFRPEEQQGVDAAEADTSLAQALLAEKHKNQELQLAIERLNEKLKLLSH